MRLRTPFLALLLGSALVAVPISVEWVVTVVIPFMAGVIIDSVGAIAFSQLLAVAVGGAVIGIVWLGTKLQGMIGENAFRALTVAVLVAISVAHTLGWLP